MHPAVPMLRLWIYLEKYTKPTNQYNQTIQYNTTGNNPTSINEELAKHTTYVCITGLHAIARKEWSKSTRADVKSPRKIIQENKVR